MTAHNSLTQEETNAQQKELARRVASIQNRTSIAELIAWDREYTEYCASHISKLQQAGLHVLFEEEFERIVPHLLSFQMKVKAAVLDQWNALTEADRKAREQIREKKGQINGNHVRFI